MGSDFTWTAILLPVTVSHAANAASVAAASSCPKALACSLLKMLKQIFP